MISAHSSTVRSGSRPRPAVALAILVLTLLTACTGSPPVTRGEPAPGASDGASAQPTAGDPDPGEEEDLAKKRVAAGIADCPPSDAAVPPVAEGLPDLALDCLGGGTPVRLAGLRGTPMVINIWAQWCGPCRQEAPFLSSVAHQVEGRDDVQFLGVDFADPRPELAIDFARLSAWKYPQLVDPLSETKAPLGVAGIPATVFVAADGRIVHTHYAPFGSEEELTDAMAEHLGVTV